MTNQEITKILCQIGEPFTDGDTEIFQMLREEDGEKYNVWRVKVRNSDYILKEAKGYELEAYQKFFVLPCDYVPAMFGYTAYAMKEYILLEYIHGENLQKSTRRKIKCALDSLIDMQNQFWESKNHSDTCLHYEKGFLSAEKRGEYLNTDLQREIYAEFLRIYRSVPRTLCHCDLLPFNVIVSGERAVMIDWEACGILPYPIPLVRLIAHGTEEEGAIFCMTAEDKRFAIEYYWENFIRGKGILYKEYLDTIDYFLFYEYCEWVYVGNRYENKLSSYYIQYSEIAEKAAKRLKEIKENA